MRLIIVVRKPHVILHFGSTLNQIFYVVVLVKALSNEVLEMVENKKGNLLILYRCSLKSTESSI